MNFIQKMFAGVPVRHDPLAQPGATKAIYDAQRIGVKGRLQYPATDIHTLLGWHRRNELAYACIEKIAQTAIDPELTVETRTGPDKYERDDSHPLRRLFVRPNPTMDGAAFVSAWLVSLHAAGIFYAEIVRNGLGLPIELWPVHPAKLTPVAGARGQMIDYYRYDDQSVHKIIPATDIFVDRFYDPTDPYNGLAPLAVALGAIDMDAAQTEYVRAFFNNGGVPSGVIKVSGRTLKQEESDSILARWMNKYSRWSRMTQAPAVLDQNADYQKIGSQLNELNSTELRDFAESRICSVFGVPPLLVGARVGLEHSNNRASAQSTQLEFWQNKASPLFKRLRTVLTWQLLNQFVDEEQIHNGLVRLNWDMTQVSALQEDVDAIQTRARANFAAGAITLDEFREKCGVPPLDADKGKVFYVPSNAQIKTEDELLTPPPPVALPPGQQPLQLGTGAAVQDTGAVN